MNNLIEFKTLLSKECQRFIQVAGQTLISPLITASLYLLIFGVNLAEKITDQNGVDYLQFIIPGLIALAVLNNAFQNASGSVIISKFHGDLQDLKVVPLRPFQIVGAYALAAMFRGMAVGIAVGCVGQGFYWLEYGKFIWINNIFMLLFFMFLGGVIFGLLGLSVSIYASNFDQVNAVGIFVVLPLIYLGGVFFSIAQMHPFWKTISYANPLLYLINGIRYSFLGVSDIPPMLSIPIALLFAGIAFFIGHYAVKHGNYSRF